MTISMTLAETAYISHIAPTAYRTPRLSRLMAILIAGITALAMVVASSVPAHADKRSDNLLKALAAIAAIGLISEAIKDDKGHARPVRAVRVPAVCAIEFGSGRGMVRGFVEGCMRDEGFNYRLPRDCATNIRIYGREDIFYSERCLQDAGFGTRAR